MDVQAFLQAVYGNTQVRIIVLLILANLVVGVAAALKAGDFRLVQLSAWLGQHVVPMVVGYGAAAVLSLAIPDLTVYGFTVPSVRDVAFATIVAALVGYVLSNLNELGLTNLPPTVAGPKTTSPPQAHT